MKSYTIEELREIVRRRDKLGHTFACIARERGISSGCLRQHYLNGKRRIEMLDHDPLGSLSVRTRNALDNIEGYVVDNLKTKAGIKQAILLGLTHKDGHTFDISRIRNYGKKCHEELCKFVGLPSPCPPIPRCPHCGKTLPKNMRKPNP